MSVEAWDQRQLCPDGACIGVIGGDGTCKVCGRAAPNWGDPRRAGLLEDPSESGDDAGEDARSDDPIAPSAPAVIGGGGAWSGRRLCSDGACIGVIGTDGRCKVCGKAGDPSADFEDADEDADDDADDDDDEDDVDDASVDEADEGSAGDGIAASEERQLEQAASELAPVAIAEASRDADHLDARKLCPDGACVGLIGANGRCKVCGKEAA